MCEVMQGKLITSLFWQDERFPNRKSSSAKLKAKKKIEIEHLGLLNKKVKILGEGIKVIFSLTTPTTPNPPLQRPKY